MMHIRPLFAGSLLSIIHILLDQTRQDELRIIGCQALFDFVNNQVGVLISSLSFLFYFFVFAAYIWNCLLTSYMTLFGCAGG